MVYPCRWYGKKNLCQYQVKRVSAQPTRGPTQPPPPAGGACSGTIIPSCDGNNKPVMTLTFDLRGGTEPNCHVDLVEVNGSDKNNQGNKCTNKAGIKVPGLKNNTSYNLVLSNGTTACASKSVANAGTKCLGGNPTATPGGGNPTNTPRPGQPTNTPQPGQPTNTPAPGQQTNTPVPGQPTNTPVPTASGGNCKIISQNLSNDCKKLTATFDIPGTTCGYGVQGDEGEVDSGSTSCKRTSNALSIDKYNGKPFINGGAYRVYVDNGAGCRAKWEGNPTMQCTPPTPTKTPVVPPAAQTSGIRADWWNPFQ